ncbi:ABC transporter permease [Mariniblastus fucicola]|uniref:ABC-2 family transporter protein n=1 Tax=Mariniblastus fucicola TaxID=980251 RepID=A0A5B9PEM6_9BACT|nr:ABC-2 family transporter protein [Mariniblastus fucicola]QEG23959.1 hypothetical protein MFFC18_38640 [Mariniblastus fucicola]
MSPSYLKVFLTFARNSLVRDMSFRLNFILTCFSSVSWALMNFLLFKIVYQHTESIGVGTGWYENEFFIFLGTIWIINSLIQTFFMTNAEEFSEMIRTGNLDFVLLKPIDTQFLISFPRVNWAQIPNGLLGLALVIYSLGELTNDPEKVISVGPFEWLLYAFYIGCGVLVMYSVMIIMASTSIWLGRNQNLHTFWFYITNFYRYPMEIYQKSGIGMALWGTFTFVIPILVVSNVPARILAQPMERGWYSWQSAYAIFAAAASLMISRWVFRTALLSYRSASS